MPLSIPSDRGARVYLIAVLLVMFGYVNCESRGVVFASAQEKMPLPPDVKSTRGGYRSHGFWHVGYLGGK